MDKAFWRAIIEDDYAVPAAHRAGDLLRELTGYLGSTDPELRDDIAYGITARWIDRQVLAPDDLRPLIDPLAANLAGDIGEEGADSVFLRSFSALVLAAFVYYDNHRLPVLDRSEARALFEKALAYAAAEKDRRGYVPGKGWAHAVAHTADLLDEFAASRHLDGADLERILAALSGMVTAPGSTILLYNEDDRLARAACSVLQREIVPRKTIAGWLDAMGGLRDRLGTATLFSDPAHHGAYINTRGFLRGLYVQLTGDQHPDSLRAWATGVRAALVRL